MPASTGTPAPSAIDFSSLTPEDMDILKQIKASKQQAAKAQEGSKATQEAEIEGE